MKKEFRIEDVKQGKQLFCRSYIFDVVDYKLSKTNDYVLATITSGQNTMVDVPFTKQGRFWEDGVTISGLDLISFVSDINGNDITKEVMNTIKINN